MPTTAFKPPKPPSAAAAYHHGDLRNALIEAALAALTHRGDSDFSLSELARGAGVTPAAAYKHFTDKQSLVAALAQIGFERLAAAFEEAAPEAAPATSARSARQRFASVGQAYLHFGVAQPALFHLMFGGAGALYRQQATAGAQPTRSFSYLLRALADLHRFGVIGQAPRPQDQWFAWSAIHGATELCLAGIAPLGGQADSSQHITQRLISALR